MKKLECEKKLLISRRAYEFLCARFGADVSSKQHINYYYDTENYYFRRNNTTCRIRQKEDRLVGTLKKHSVENASKYSIEETFRVEKLPIAFEVDSRRVFLRGQLLTDRLKVELSSGLVLALDKNIYLGDVDYEVEIEYSKNTELEAEGVRLLLSKLLSIEGSLVDVPSKSERFFRKLVDASGQEIAHMYSKEYNPDGYLERDIFFNGGRDNGKS